ncbi:MAG: DUF2277 domain-containing protein [Ardenticatenaceae bacterium]|nr:DUF2277 domain-containing protein [Anaerolineales bacterium]MCB8941812.1 DUF2277 domain-containing protein [Ardenticatenaceae bacterium]MCB8972924.1 DUF2277 domain-containing protein [Ardenticatenaceae bacterium]
MCRSIKQLRNAETPATAEEIEAAVRQFVRKVSGYRRPSRTNEAAFEQAISEISVATQKLLNNLVTPTKKTV